MLIKMYAYFLRRIYALLIFVKSKIKSRNKILHLMEILKFKKQYKVKL